MTAILTQRCDPFGVEVERYGEKLAGGLHPDASAGTYVWYCKEPVIGRYRMICTGGDYGFRRQADGGLIRAYHCDGGHQGQVMALCKVHVREYSVGPPAPGFTRDKRTPYGQVGGTKANEMCPRCAGPPEALPHMARAEFLHAQLSKFKSMPIPLLVREAAIESELNAVRQTIDELHERGVIHKCPLILREVS